MAESFVRQEVVPVTYMFSNNNCRVAWQFAVVCVPALDVLACCIGLVRKELSVCLTTCDLLDSFVTYLYLFIYLFIFI
jgi:hypothetical protein